MRLTEYFGLPEDVPFYDVDSHDDTRVFLDPSRIRWARSGDEFTSAAANCLGSFSQLLVTGVETQDEDPVQHVENVLSALKEPKETHLGMSAKGICGHGAARTLGERMLQAIRDHSRILVELRDFDRIEQLALVVPGIDSDIMSDMATRIVMGPLTEYTVRQMGIYPQLRSRDTIVARLQIWDIDTASWASQTYELPAVDGEPLLLVPTHWVGSKILLNHERYFSTTVLSHIQDQTASVLPSGKVEKISKKNLRRRREYRPARVVSRLQAVEAALDGIGLISRFEVFAERKFRAEQMQTDSERAA